MTWALIRDSDGEWLQGPLSEEPEPGAGEYAVLVALRFPDSCSWSSERRAFIDADAAAPLRAIDFHLLFTQAERIAVRGSGDPVVVDFLTLSVLSPTISLAHAMTVAGVEYLEAAGLLAPGRAAAVLSGIAPA